MKRAVLPAALIMAVLLAAPASEATVRSLSFEERVEAQRAIERVYYAHMVDTRRTFEQAVPEALLERKVRTYLEQSDALARNWDTPVTAAMLEAEAARIARQTRFPERLEEIRAALGYDDGLLLETLVRSTLVDRLAHGFHAYDERVHGAARAEAERLHGLLAGGTLDPNAAYPLRTVLEEGTPSTGATAPRTRMDVAEDEGTAEQVEQLRQTAPGAVGEIGGIRDDPGGYVINVTLASEPGYVKIASYRVPKTSWESWWGAHESEYDAGRVSAVADGGANALSHLGASAAGAAVSCTQDDTWDNGQLAAVPDGRYSHQAIWTGTEMIIWGGGTNPSTPGNAGRYDPLTDTWRSLPLVGAPPTNPDYTSVWTGSEMIVWLFSGGTSTRGGRYDPVSDTWAPVSNVGAGSTRYGHSAIWTGSEMIVWGGSVGTTVFAEGGKYNPATDTWTPISMVNAPEGRRNHTAVWTGHEMIVWGGERPLSSSQSVQLGTGGRYDPATDTWTALSDVGSPVPRTQQTAIWTGHEMIVWGGYYQPVPWYENVLSTGGRYDPASDTWTPTTTIGAPGARGAHTVVWTGSRMIVWGGSTNPTNTSPGAMRTGGLYDPATDSWEPTSEANAPQPVLHHTAVWTGSQMIVWGGKGAGSIGATRSEGGRYDPEADTWTPTANRQGGVAPTGNGPIVWTGTEMLAWSLGGGRYDPMTDSWRGITESGQPEPRQEHVAVWTGDEMLVWGGWASRVALSSGGRYDPLADAWRPMSTIGGPVGRQRATAVWTDSEMIIWGGYLYCSSPCATGAIYDPYADTWRPMSPLTGLSPHGESKVALHSAIWTGHEMIVFGGRRVCGGPFCNEPPLDEGARYDPVHDQWTRLPPLPSGQGRDSHVAAWTGRKMIVFGGVHGTSFPTYKTGWIYDRVDDAWSELPVPSSYWEGGSYQTAVWTGRHMLIYGSATANIYDANSRVWSTMSTQFQPQRRAAQAAVWTGHEMLVWSGLDVYQGIALPNGGRYIFGQSSDDDGDGLSECTGDCDDTDASTWPGAPEMCNGRDNDCNGLVDDDADGVDTDGDGQANACDACPAFANPGQSSPLACMTAQQDGGRCLETKVMLAEPIQQGEVRLVRDHPAVPDLIHIDFNVSSCSRIDPIEVYLNGQLLATFIEPSATCVCEVPLYRVTITDQTLLASLWNTSGDNVFRVFTPVAPQVPPYLGSFVGWVRVRIGSGDGVPAEDVCIHDVDGGDCTEPDQCVGGYNRESVDESRTVQTKFVAEDVVSATPFAGTLPASVDIGTVPDGPMKMCVGPSGPARLYAADGAGGLYLVDPATGAASAAGSLPFGVSALAHDDLTRRTWAQSDLPGDHSLAEIDLIGGRSLGVSSFLGLTFSGMEMVGGRVYGVESRATGARLKSVEPDSGYETTVRTLTNGEWDGLTYEPATGFLYATRTLNGQSALLTLDGFGGSILGERPLSFRPTALEFGPGGVLYATRDAGSDTGLYTIDPATGAEALVGSLGVPGVVTLTTARNLPRACLDIVKQGERTLSTGGSCNASPLAVAVMASQAECASPAGASVMLDGSGSTDADSTPGTHDDIVLFEWFEDFGPGTGSLLGTGEHLEVVLPLGPHAITLRVTDAAGATGTDTATVSVVDSMKPAVTVAPAPDLLWPPNHRMVSVTPRAAAIDACDPSPSLALVSVVSGEPDDMAGEADGHTTDDVQGADIGQPDTEVMLRAERAGTGSGRLYTITYAATDASGNTGTGEAVVFVPHDQGGVTEPILLDVLASGIEWTPAAGAISYNVLRGMLSRTWASGSYTVMQDTVCVARGVPGAGVAGGALVDDPPPGEAFSYLVEYFDGGYSGYGTARGVGEVVVVSGDSCH